MQYTVQKVIRREIPVRSGDDRREGSETNATRRRILQSARALKKMDDVGNERIGNGRLGHVPDWT
jgi:hypothetical protein